MVDKQWCVFQI